MSETVLYQWPPAQGTESIYPRCVVFQRICNIAHQEIKVVNVKLPKADEKFSAKLKSRLIGLPILEANGKKLLNSTDIINHLIHSDPSRESKAKLLKLASAHSFITLQWANESFIHSLVYARWMREENFRRFVQNVKWGEPYSDVEIQVDQLRQEILRYLKHNPIGEMNETSYLGQLQRQLWSLNHILAAQDFLEPLIPYPSLSDLNVFMVVQGLLSPDLEESKIIQNDYPHILKWFYQVDELTKKR